MGIEPTMPLLSQSIIGFEDRGRHQSGTHFHDENYTETVRAERDATLFGFVNLVRTSSRADTRGIP
jgi:hypothetical protein